MRIHEYLEIHKDKIGNEVISCLKCGYIFCNAEENYKKYSLLIKEKLDNLNLRFLTSGEDTKVIYFNYVCPGCGVLLEVDSICPDLNKDDPILWDIQIDLSGQNELV